MAEDDETLRTVSVARDWEAIRPDIDPATFSIMIHLTRMGLLASQNSADISARFGINGADARLLMAIRGDRTEKPIRPSELGQRLDLTRATITYRMDRLLAKGLVESSSDANDGRALNVRLTAKGETMIDAIMTEINAVSQERLAAVDHLPGGRAAFNAFLIALVARWENPEAGQ